MKLMTTTALALLSEGWDYLGDDAVWLRRRAGHAAPQLVIDFMLPSLGCAPQRRHPGLLGEMNGTASEYFAHGMLVLQGIVAKKRRPSPRLTLCPLKFARPRGSGQCHLIGGAKRSILNSHCRSR